MKISISKKFSGKRRAIIAEVLKLAKADFDLSDMRSLRISPMNKTECTQFGGYAYVSKCKGLVKLDPHAEPKELIETLAHEMCHVGQFAEYRLVDSKNWAIWKFCFALPHALTRIHVFGNVKYNPFYWFAPWEIEARKYAAKIMKEIS